MQPVGERTYRFQGVLPYIRVHVNQERNVTGKLVKYEPLKKLTNCVMSVDINYMKLICIFHRSDRRHTQVHTVYYREQEMETGVKTAIAAA